MECDSSVKPIDSREQDRILARRLKNRERQRRYRARRRLEAKTKNTYIVNLSTSLTLESQPNGVFTNDMNCVQCHRKWKEDARRAHASREPEVALHKPESPVVNHGSGHATEISPSKDELDQPAEIEVQSKRSSVSLYNPETNETTHGRRDWKLDARRLK
ncbi:hypothetical protein IFM89_003539 [Coptis chinensis]|uniref:BZIP domain-containing protein n=1 Tax=Coptis chinensis TaxID=261450 RepID=A0A835IWM9_9MAGN|nr:hypothetical protein IFM89_003539 [Coptis chinensis]